MQTSTPFPEENACPVSLKKGELLRIVPEPSDELWIACRRGVLWITCEGMAADLFLTAGQSYRCRAGGLTLLEALEPAEVALDYFSSDLAAAI